MTKEIYKIVDEHGNTQGVYDRSCRTTCEFDSPYDARKADVNDRLMDRQYKVQKYKVTYELIDDDCKCNEETEKLIDKKTYERENPDEMTKYFEKMLNKVFDDIYEYSNKDKKK